MNVCAPVSVALVAAAMLIAEYSPLLNSRRRYADLIALILFLRTRTLRIQVSKWRPSAILDFQKFKISTAVGFISGT